MKAMTKQQLAQCAGVTVRTLIKEISAISAISAGLKKLQTDLLSRRNKGNKGKMTSKEISAISAISAGHKKNYAYNQFYSDSLFRNAE